MERTEAWLVDWRLFIYHPICKGWFAWLAASPERQSRVRCMKMKLDHPFSITYKAKLVWCNGAGEELPSLSRELLSAFKCWCIEGGNIFLLFFFLVVPNRIVLRPTWAVKWVYSIDEIVWKVNMSLCITGLLVCNRKEGVYEHQLLYLFSSNPTLPESQAFTRRGWSCMSCAPASMRTPGWERSCHLLGVAKRKENLDVSTPRATAYLFGIWGCTVLLLFNNNNNKPPLTKKNSFPCQQVLKAESCNEVFE